MKKTLFLILLAFIGSSAAFAQIGFVDTKLILEKLPDYNSAQRQLDILSTQWQREIDGKQSALDAASRDYEGEKVMLSPDLQKKREGEIFDRSKEIRELQRRRFGYEGDLSKKRVELIQPIRDKVSILVQEIAAKRGYAAVLDKSEGITVMYRDPKLDISEEVIEALGIK